MARRNTPAEERVFANWIALTPEQKTAFDRLVKGYMFRAAPKPTQQRTRKAQPAAGHAAQAATEQ